MHDSKVGTGQQNNGTVWKEDQAGHDLNAGSCFF